MNEGAFALIDCLGFKGIWKRADPTLLIQKLSKIEQTVHDEIISVGKAFTHLSYGPIKLNVRLLSDTVAISLQYEVKEDKAPENWQKNFLVGIICTSVIQVLDLFLEGGPPLVLRGCISYGEHLSEGNFIAGPAVDEAAEYMNIAEGAFVWLLPSAEERYIRLVARNMAMFYMIQPEVVIKAWKILQERGFHELDWALEAAEKYGAESVVKSVSQVLIPFVTMPIVISSYKMPLKTGAQLQCAIINPLAFKKTEEEQQKAIESYSNIITGNRLDVWLKRQNTLEFLKIAADACASFHKKISDLKSGQDTEEGKE